jgi:very-short-patch-repair endonuclease
MDYNKRLRELQEEIEEVKDMQHNQGMNAAARPFQQELRERATAAELKFMHITQLKGLHLKFQYKINIMCKNGRRIKRFYFADFCDSLHKLIFEIDGEYHDTHQQQKKDLQRTKDLCREGYKVFRITNAEVFAGKTTEFLYKAYLSIGIKI